MEVCFFNFSSHDVWSMHFRTLRTTAFPYYLSQELGLQRYNIWRRYCNSSEQMMYATFANARTPAEDAVNCQVTVLNALHKEYKGRTFVICNILYDQTSSAITVTCSIDYWVD